MTKFIKRIQTHLSRNGKQISQGQIREIYQTMVSDEENPSDEEMNAIKEHFMNATAIEPVDSVWTDVKPSEKTLVSKLIDEQVTPETPKKPSSTLATTTNEPTSLSKAEANELITNAIKAAPSEIKQNLFLQYAEKEFQTVRDLLAFKQAIDNQIDSFLSTELQKQNQERSAKWRATKEQFTQQSDLEVAERLEVFQDYLSNLQTRMAEFKLN